MIQQDFEYFPSLQEILKGICFAFQENLKKNILNQKEYFELPQDKKERQIGLLKDLIIGYT